MILRTNDRGVLAMGKYLMGIDRGTTNIKAAVYDLDGKEIKVKSRPCEKVKSPQPGFAEQDMERIWMDAVEVIRMIWDEQITPEQIVAIGVSGQGGGLFAIDGDNQPVRKGIVSLDSRVRHAADVWRRENTHRRFLELWNYGNPTMPAPLLYWLREFEPDVYGKIRWVLQSKDWIRYKLTGEVHYETTDASNGYLLDSSLRYRLDVFADYGLEEAKEMFPELLCPWEKAGYVTEEAAALTGLRAGTPVAAGGHDVAMVAFGTGCHKAGQLTTVLGTFGLNLLVIDRPHIMLEHCAKVVLSGSKSSYLMMNGGNTGAVTEWFVDTFCAEEKKNAAQNGTSVYEIIEDAVLKAPHEGRSDVVCHPFAEPPFTLDGYENARFGFFGITSRTTRPEIVRAFYEGIAIEMSLSLDVLKRAVGEIDCLRLIGGGASSRLWGQMFADTCGLPVRIPDIKEAGCRGAALNAGIAAGIYKDHAIAEELDDAVRRVYIPRKEGSVYMADKKKRFKEIARLLQSTWEQTK